MSGFCTYTNACPVRNIWRGHVQVTSGSSSSVFTINTYIWKHTLTIMLIHCWWGSLCHSAVNQHKEDGGFLYFGRLRSIRSLSPCWLCITQSGSVYTGNFSVLIHRLTVDRAIRGSTTHPLRCIMIDTKSRRGWHGRGTGITAECQLTLVEADFVMHLAQRVWEQSSHHRCVHNF